MKSQWSGCIIHFKLTPQPLWTLFCHFGIGLYFATKLGGGESSIVGTGSGHWKEEAGLVLRTFFSVCVRVTEMFNRPQ